MGCTFVLFQEREAQSRVCRERGECVCQCDTCNGKRRRVAELLTRVVFCGAYIVGKSNVKWAVYCCGYRSERNDVRLGQEDVIEHASLLLAAGKDGQMPSD